jgi:hypothetical protein
MISETVISLPLLICQNIFTGVNSYCENLNIKKVKNLKVETYLLIGMVAVKVTYLIPASSTLSKFRFYM